jgi:hypothetical protein
MTNREAQLVLITGWCQRHKAGWRIYDPTPGDASAWVHATAAEQAAIEHVLATMPAIASIYQGIVDHADGHRGDCRALRYHACTCRVPA